MFKLDRKLIISASVATAMALSFVGCVENSATPNASVSTTGDKVVDYKYDVSHTYANGKKVIDGGVTYPVVNSETNVYHVNEKTLKGGYTNGRTPTAGELKAWDKDMMADGTGFPEGSGTAEDGEEVYEEKCVMCHGDFGSGGGGYPSLAKGNAYELQKTLKNQRNHPDDDGPVRVFGSYWPHVSTLLWYIMDGMPHPKSKTLTNDEAYSLVAYILNLNEIKIDGELVEDDTEINAEMLKKVVMPNVNGFEPNIDGAGALDRVRNYYANPTNFGAQKANPADRCMSGCQKPTAKVVHIKGAGISDFLPPMATTRDLPEVKAPKGNAEKAIYEENCMVCHAAGNSMGAPEFGNKAVWAAYTSQGMNKLYSDAIHGINGMPPKGGTTLSDKEFKSVVDYILKNSK